MNLLELVLSTFSSPLFERDRTSKPSIIMAAESFSAIDFDFDNDWNVPIQENSDATISASQKRKPRIKWSDEEKERLLRLAENDMPMEEIQRVRYYHSSITLSDSNSLQKHFPNRSLNALEIKHDVR